MILEPPPYTHVFNDVSVGLAVEDMKRHTTDEGFQLFAGLEHAGYDLAGFQLPYNETDVRKIVDHFNPGTMVLQDKREWSNMTSDRKQDPRYRFENVQYLKDHTGIFKVTVLKDAQNNNLFHRESANEIGCHAWIVYYDRNTICELAPFVRKQHLIRTWHTVDRELIPEYSPEGRKGCLLSGAVSRVYPLRQRLTRIFRTLPEVEYLRHPGYHSRGSHTPGYLRTLSRYKVAICTSSIYGYALRKIIEATACGCTVVTDLPRHDHLPIIDSNLVRVPRDISAKDLSACLEQLYRSYDSERQAYYSQQACIFYDYRAMGKRLAQDIQFMRQSYVSPNGAD